MPQSAIDPVIMAAHSAVRLQTIILRETSPLDSAVLTIGTLQAGLEAMLVAALTWSAVDQPRDRGMIIAFLLSIVEVWRREDD